MFILNDVLSTLRDKTIEVYMEKQKYEQVISECKKWRIFIKTFVGRKITVLSKQ